MDLKNILKINSQQFLYYHILFVLLWKYIFNGTVQDGAAVYK